MKQVVYIILGAGIFITSCSQPEKKEPPVQEETTQVPAQTYSIPDSILVEKARMILAAIAANEDAVFLAQLPTDTLIRFSPYTYIDTANDQLLTAAQVKALMASGKVITWGDQAGSGDPIKKSFRDYAKRYIYDTNFLDSSIVSIDSFHSTGNTIDNVRKVYPNARIIEFYRNGTEKYSNMDWRSLKIVFEEKKDMLYPVAFIHNEWTP